MPANPAPPRPSPRLAALLLSLALVLYMVIRAVKVGFTHDESSSFMNLIDEPARDLFFNQRNWRAANNHLLNSLCMQVGNYFFGAQEWALRWGSLVAGVAYLIYAFRTVRLWLPSTSWYFFAAFCLLALQHFVLDFFSLARGYGGCLAFEMAGLFYFFRWIQQHKQGDLFKAAGALSAGVLANFTLLDVLAAFFATVTVVFYFKNERRFAIVPWLRTLAPPMLPVLITALLIFQPMRWISAQGELEYGPQAFWETWRILVDRFVFDAFPRQKWWKVVEMAVATPLLLLLGFSMFRRFKRSPITGQSSLFFAACLTLFTMLATVLQHYLLGANYLSGRTAVLFYPLFTAVVVLYLVDARARLLWRLATAFMIVNFCAHFNVHYALEWQYDADTRDALVRANQLSDPRHKLNYGVTWEVYSSTLFYQQTRGLFNIDTVRYNGSHDNLAWAKEQPFDLLYVPQELGLKITDQFTPLQSFSQGLLLQRK